MTKGLLSHVQRFSVHDGPGIRTAVFLKGCQMRCAWCHNPETYHPRRELQVVAARCIGCGQCVQRCEHDARRMTDDGLLFDRALCVACGRCAATCYAKALVLLGREASAAEIVAEIAADHEFYADSGGVTLSGGEPLCQPQFALEVLRLCKDEGIATALETNLACPWPTVVPFLPLVDLFMVDVKIFDDALHRKWTGVSNRPTLENLKLLAKERKPLIVRTPVIAGLNDSPEQIASIAELLAGLSNVMYYELLPYHPLGVGKYQGLGLEPPPSQWQPPDSSRLKLLADVVRGAGLEVRVAGHNMVGCKVS